MGGSSSPQSSSLGIDPRKGMEIVDGFIEVPLPKELEEFTEVLEPEAVKVPEHFDLCSSSNESVSDSEVSSEDDVSLRSLKPVVLEGVAGNRAPANAICSAKLFHLRLKTLHLVHKADPKKLACGRYIHAGFSLWEAKEGSPSEDYPRCAVCFGKHRNSTAPLKP